MVSISIDDETLLRTFQPDDAAELFHTIDTSRRHLQPWFNWVDTTTKPEHSLQFIQQSLQQLQNQEALALGIFYQGHIIGSIGMHHWDHTLKRAQIGYWIGKDFEGKGIIHRCLPPFINFLFNKATLNKIEVHFMLQNKRSAKVAERLGCKVEGIIRQSNLRNGMLHDVVIAGLLRSEWQATSNNNANKRPL